jgi:hypothetical protein
MDLMDAPQVLCIDVDYQTRAALGDQSLEVLQGIFGVRYNAEESYGQLEQLRILINPSKNWEDSCLVLIDQAAPLVELYSAGTPDGPRSSLSTWVKCDSDEVDARPACLNLVESRFTRMLQRGAVFCVMAETGRRQELVRGHGDGYQVVTKNKLQLNLFSFLPATIADQIQCAYTSGRKYATEASQPLGRFLESSAGKIHYNAEFELGSVGAQVAAVSINGNPISFKLTHDLIGKGTVYVLPRFDDEPTAMIAFFNEFLPSEHPELFPHRSSHAWRNDPRHALAEVAEVDDKIGIAERTHAAAMAELQTERETVVSSLTYLYDLLSCCDADLVNAVATVLSELGFAEITHVDLASEQAQLLRREDLRVNCGESTLVIEVKGLSGRGKDEDLTAAAKYVAGAMRELSSTNVSALSIINHERHIPPKERSSTIVRPELVETLVRQHVGVVTTVSLLAMLRRMRSQKWSHEDICQMLAVKGEITPLPARYRPVGKIAKLFKKQQALGIDSSGPLSCGDIVAVECGFELFESEVVSLRQADVDVSTIELGEVGVKCSDFDDRLKEGMSVYRVG